MSDPLPKAKKISRSTNTKKVAFETCEEALKRFAEQALKAHPNATAFLGYYTTTDSPTGVLARCGYINEQCIAVMSLLSSLITNHPEMRDGFVLAIAQLFKEHNMEFPK